MDNKKYAVDRIEGNKVILNVLETKEIIEVPSNLILAKIQDADILINKNGLYYKDDIAKEKRLQEIMAKFNKVKK